MKKKFFGIRAASENKNKKIVGESENKFDIRKTPSPGPLSYRSVKLSRKGD